MVYWTAIKPPASSLFAEEWGPGWHLREGCTSKRDAFLAAQEARATYSKETRVKVVQFPDEEAVDAWDKAEPHYCICAVLLRRSGKTEGVRCSCGVKVFE
jgi:hypothetical protein